MSEKHAVHPVSQHPGGATQSMAAIKIKQTMGVRVLQQETRSEGSSMGGRPPPANQPARPYTARPYPESPAAPIAAAPESRTAVLSPNHIYNKLPQIQ